MVEPDVYRGTEPLNEKVHPPLSVGEGAEGAGLIGLLVIVALETRMLLGDIRAMWSYQCSQLCSSKTAERNKPAT